MQSPSSKKLVIISGGSSRIGIECALDQARRGADVVALYFSSVSAAAGLSILSEREGLQIAVRACDIRDKLQVAELAADLLRGAPRKIAVVHLASQPRVSRRVIELDWAEMSGQAETTVLGALNLVKSFGPAMMEQNWGRFVFVLSTAMYSIPVGYGSYVSAKAALKGLAGCCAVELGVAGVTCNCVSLGRLSADPCSVDGRKRARVPPARRFGSERDAAGAIAWLVAEDADFVNGSEVIVDGGALRVEVAR